MKFLVDMPVTPRAVARLQAAGHDAVHAGSVGLSTGTDDAILAVARAEGRVVVTADLDYPRLLALQRADGPGVVLFRGGSYSTTRCSACSNACWAARTSSSWNTRLPSSTACA